MLGQDWFLRVSLGCLLGSSPHVTPDWQGKQIGLIYLDVVCGYPKYTHTHTHTANQISIEKLIFKSIQSSYPAFIEHSAFPSIIQK